MGGVAVAVYATSSPPAFTFYGRVPEGVTDVQYYTRHIPPHLRHEMDRVCHFVSYIFNIIISCDSRWISSLRTKTHRWWIQRTLLSGGAPQQGSPRSSHRGSKSCFPLSFLVFCVAIISLFVYVFLLVFSFVTFSSFCLTVFCSGSQTHMATPQTSLSGRNTRHRWNCGRTFRQSHVFV